MKPYEVLTVCGSEYHFKFTAANDAAIILPSGSLYATGNPPIMVVGHVYEYSIINNLVVVGEFF